MTPMQWTARQAIRPPPTYAAAQTKVMRRPEDTPTARSILTLLRRRKAWVKIQDIEGKLDMSRSTAGQALQRLINAGLVERQPGGFNHVGGRPFYEYRAI